MSESRTVLIDGYNVIRRTPQLAQAEKRSLQHGRDALITLLAFRHGNKGHRITVVFDGDDIVESRETRMGIVLIYSSYDQTADDCLVRLAHEARTRGESVIVATDDGGIRAALGGLIPDVRPTSASTMGRDLYAAPRLLEKAYRHRTAVKRAIEERDDPDLRARPRHGNPKRAPKRKH